MGFLLSSPLFTCTILCTICPSLPLNSLVTLDILDDHLLSLLLLPHTSTDNSTESKKHTQSDAQTPDSLHLIASGFAGPNPFVVIALLHVLAHAGNERSCKDGRG